MFLFSGNLHLYEVYDVTWCLCLQRMAKNYLLQIYMEWRKKEKSRNLARWFSFVLYFLWIICINTISTNGIFSCLSLKMIKSFYVLKVLVVHRFTFVLKQHESIKWMISTGKYNTFIYVVDHQSFLSWCKKLYPTTNSIVKKVISITERLYFFNKTWALLRWTQFIGLMTLDL